MNESNPDPFEALLRSQTLRQPPLAWRNEILAAASRAHAPGVEPAKPGVLDILYSRLASVLWPSPSAWAGLAAIWLIILGVNLASVQKPPPMAKAASAPAAQLRMAFREQNQLLQELIGPAETAQPKHRPPPVTKPRTERKNPVMAT